MEFTIKSVFRLRWFYWYVINCSKNIWRVYEKNLCSDYIEEFFLDFVGQSLNNKAKIGLTIETLKWGFMS